MSDSPLSLSRLQILSFRRATGGLKSRLPRGVRSLRRVAWAGLQDSMPRAAVLSVNARMERTTSTVWEDPGFVQIWGPRYSLYVIPAQDRAVFTLGRLPGEGKARDRAYDLATQLAEVLDGGSLPFGEVGRALGGHANRLRYAATTGTVLLRWDGARQPTVRTVEPPDVDPLDARRELARRFLHVFGPSTPDGFARWAGMSLQSAIATFDRLQRALQPVITPIGSGWILRRDMDTIREPSEADREIRLLPSGDAYFLLQGKDRTLLVPDANQRESLWTSRVWPGAILADGEIVGTWRRSKNRVTAHAWTRLSRRVRDAVTAEATSLPLPEAEGDPTIDWAE